MRVSKTGITSLIIAVSITFSLNAALFESNKLGQSIREIQEAEKSQLPYTLLITQENTNTTISSLYHNEMLIQKKVELVQKDDTTITITTYMDDVITHEIVTVYNKGLPLSITEKGVNGTFITLFRYESGQLIEKKEIHGDVMSRLTTYYRNSDGSLALTREIELDENNHISFYTQNKDSTIFTEQTNNEVIKNTIHPSLVVTSEYSVEGKIIQTVKSEVDSIGQLSIEERLDGDSILSLYSVDGMLIEKHITHPSGERVDYIYEYDAKGRIVHSTQIITAEKIERIERYYTNGTLKSNTQFIDESPVKSTRYNEDGTSIVTLFEEERPYADVTYASDGKRVLSIEYRKEQ